MPKQTPSQTVGPYFAYALTPQDYGRQGITGSILAAPETAGEHIRLQGRVFDGEGQPVTDALIEIWQADAAGRYRHPSDARFTGFGRAGTDSSGGFAFETVKPGMDASGQAPHISVIVLARGMLSHAFTRIYFADETAANADDPVLRNVPTDRRHTLLAERVPTPGGILYRFDIHLQGEAETVFFDA